MERTLKELQDIIYGCWYEPEQVKPEEQSAIPKALERHINVYGDNAEEFKRNYDLK